MRVGLLEGTRRAGALLLLREAEVGPGPRAGGRGRRVGVLRAGGGRGQRLVWTLSHHVRDALAVVAFLWLGGQPTLLGMVVQTSTVVTAAKAKGDGIFIPRRTGELFRQDSLLLFYSKTIVILKNILLQHFSKNKHFLFLFSIFS